MSKTKMNTSHLLVVKIENKGHNLHVIRSTSNCATYELYPLRRHGLGGMYYDCSMSIILYLAACIMTVRCLSYCT